MAEEQYRQWVSQLGSKINLPELKADENHYCCLSFDDEIILHLQYNKEADVLMLFSQLGTIHAENQNTLYPRILKANLFWQGTGGATIGVDDETREVLMAYQTPLAMLDFAKFEALVEGFINTAEIWIKTLTTIQKEETKH